MIAKSSTYSEALSLIRRLSRREQIDIIREVMTDFAPTEEAITQAMDDNPLTSEEIQALMSVEPLPPQEVIAMGLTGTWARYGIQDGGEWADEQRRLRIQPY
jgi:hypothetical protein